MNCLNLNGWTENNKELKEKLIVWGSPDVVCLSETHLKGNEIIAVDGYSYVGLNRKTENRRGSGGVGLLYKRTMQNSHDINICYKFEDNVIGVSFLHQDSSESSIIYSVYLPPENSKYGQYNEQILNSLTIEMYKQNEADLILLCGDFNARIGGKNDCPLNEEIRVRKHLDPTYNQQGLKLIDFLCDTKMCVINGRVTPEADDMTSTTGYRGSAVVDYCIT